VENRDAKIVEKILSLKRERNAVILAVNFEMGEVQDYADFVCDYLELSHNAG